MKKLSYLLVTAGIFAFVACGPSAQEKAEKARQDSIRIADSIAQIEAIEKARMDSIANAEKEKRIQDSIAKATEEAAKKGGKKK